MIYLEAFQLTVLMMLFINTAVSDLRTGTVSNKAILSSLIAGLISAIPYYALFVTDCLPAFAINNAISIVISFLLYVTGIWGAGDSKLLSVTTLVFPARLYCLNGRTLASTFLLISIVFILAFVYVLIDTLVIGIKKKDLFKPSRYGIDWKACLKGFLFFFFSFELINCLLFSLLPETLLTDKTFLAAILFVETIICLELEKKANWLIIGIMGLAYIVLLLLKRIVLDVSSINWKIYIIVIALLLFRILADKYNYKTIKVSELKPGMILSMTTTLLFSKSKVSGLPAISSEDLKSRLNAEEVENISRWSKTKNGNDSVVIVRKIPFASFIGLGTLIFTLLEVLVA